MDVIDESYHRLVEDVQGLMARGAHPAALARLEEALASRRAAGPEHAFQLQILLTLDRRREAASALKAAATLSIDDADVADGLAFFARELDQHELSNELYRQATQLSPEAARFWFNLATSERSLGNFAGAVNAIRRSCKLDPDMNGAILLRSEMTRATAQANNIAELQTRLALAADANSGVVLSYALAKELHDLGRYDEAFAAYSRGAQARRRALKYDVAQDERKLVRIQEAFPAGSSQPRSSDRPARHIFIIGLPRSGTTLMERILGALPHVRSNNETNNFATALMRYGSPDGRDVFERAAHADFEAVGREYDALATGDGFAGSIIEKLPFNYLYVGPILQAIPDAAIVALRRHPIDSCFAMYRTLFAAAYPFSYRFDELARYYAAYEQLMRHWEKAYPGRIIFVDYEDLVHTPGTVAADVAGRCGLAWSDDALELNRNSAASLTASAAQIRGEIYTSSAGGWRHYRNHLRPLADALRTCGVEVRWE